MAMVYFRYRLAVPTYPYDGLHQVASVGYRNHPCRSDRASPPAARCGSSISHPQGSTCPRLTPRGQRPPSCPTAAT
ncbi:hypothetical protein FAIPA1_10097 [Frankia sp. AiPs1]